MSWKAFISRNLQSVKIMADPVAQSSASARAFWSTNYAEVKALNPRFPFMLRANGGVEPYMLVEYDFARKVKVELGGLAPEAIEGALAQAVAEGNSMPRALHQSVEPLQQPAVIE